MDCSSHVSDEIWSLKKHELFICGDFNSKIGKLSNIDIDNGVTRCVKYLFKGLITHGDFIKRDKTCHRNLINVYVRNPLFNQI